MNCPHCNATVFPADYTTEIQESGPGSNSECLPWVIRHTCCPSCKDFIILAVGPEERVVWVYPTSRARRAVPSEVPLPYRNDYMEAAELLLVSPKSSAALGRRCLQSLLHDMGCKSRSLDQEIAKFLSRERGVSVELQQLLHLGQKVDNFGKLSLTDWPVAVIVKVEPHEAELCLDIADELFDHIYLRPQRVQEKQEELELKFGTKKPPS